MLSVYAVFIPALILFAFFRISQSRKARFSRLPPGPKSSLILGTKIPQLYPWRYFYKLSQEYGPLLTIWNGSSPTIICSSVQAVEELLEKQARDTADRPPSIVGDEVFSHGKRILLVGYNERWRRLRKALHSSLQPESARQFRPVQEKAAKEIVNDILRDPGHFQNHIKTYAATVVVKLGYGRSDKAYYDSPDIQKIIVAADHLGQLIRPGAYRVDSFPWLRYVPGYLSIPRQWGAEELTLFREALADARKKAASGKAVPSFASYMTEKQKEFGLNDDEIAYLCGSIFGAGSDTSSSAITIIVMAAATCPDSQKRIQSELDQVVGHERLPTFEDLEDLPLLRAFISESYRWRPVSSGGFAHRTTAELGYGNYVFPVGTPIIGNHWAVHRDTEYYGHDVDTFNINRWLTDDLKDFNTKMKYFQFGFGRRVCPGQHIANQSVFITAAILLWAFSISKKKDSTGQEIDIDTLAFTNTANSHPLPFKAHFEQRISGLQSKIEIEQS